MINYGDWRKAASVKNNSFCIILTSFCTPDRIPLYKSRVKRWIEDTPYDIFLVDSNNTGLGLSGSRYREILFDQFSSDWYIKGKEAGGFLDQSVCESESMKYVINYLNLHNIYDYIFKITAKYFIPNFQVISYMPKTANFIVQYREDHPKWVNTEVYGVSSKIIQEFLDQCPSPTDNTRKHGVLKNSLESYMYKLSHKYGFVKMPRLDLDMFTQRQDGLILKWL